MGDKEINCGQKLEGKLSGAGGELDADSHRGRREGAELLSVWGRDEHGAAERINLRADSG